MATVISEEEVQALDAIKKNCEQLSTQLRELQANIDYKQSSLPPNLPAKLKALVEKEKAYKAEIEFTKRQHLNSLPGWDKDEVRSKVHSELTTLVANLEGYKDELRVLVERADEDLVREKLKLEEHMRINTVLRQKLETHEPVQEIETMNSEERAYQHVTGKLKYFLERQYPAPQIENAESEDNASKKRKKGSEVANFKESNGKSLLELIGELTHIYANYLKAKLKKKDPMPVLPYSNVTDYWRPYVDLLVMAGIAEYNAKDSTFLRLVEFD